MTGGINNLLFISAALLAAACTNDDEKGGVTSIAAPSGALPPVATGPASPAPVVVPIQPEPTAGTTPQGPATPAPPAATRLPGVVVTIPGLNAGVFNANAIAVNLASDGVVQISYKFGTPELTSCSVVDGYSPPEHIPSNGLSLDISTLADGPHRLCFLTPGPLVTANDPLPLISARSNDWVRDSLAPAPAPALLISTNVIGTLGAVDLSWLGATDGTSQTDTLSYQTYALEAADGSPLPELPALMEAHALR